jgi:ribonuclease HI
MTEIYTDGSCRNNPGPGCYGYIVYENNQLKYAYTHRVNTITTNNVMELSAILEALRYIHVHGITQQCKLYTDSQYVRMGILTWSNNWIKNNWCTSDQKPVMNKLLWQQILQLYSGHIHVEWIRAHTTHTDRNSLRNALIDNLIR